MRKGIALLLIVATVAFAVPAFAELQNVLVGGSIRVRGNYYDFDDNGGNSLANVEQRTRLNVRADFTEAVSAFIELDAWEIWGDNTFRSNYLTGVDSRAPNGRVQVYQSYIEANEMWGTGLKVRVGRQELKLGSGWLVGNNDKAPYFRGLSFDGVRVTYAAEQFSVDGFWAKLAENSPIQEDGDVDLYGVYGSYLGIENVTLDAYWLFIRDAANFTNSLDTHTFGLRGAGTLGAFDFEAEGAYQLMDWESNENCWGHKADFSSDAFAGNLEVGYTFDMTYTPRVFLGGAYFEGYDNDGEDVSFNRLFSNWTYSNSLFAAKDGNLSNFWTAHAGVSAMPTETVKVMLSGAYLAAVEDYVTSRCLWWKNYSSKDLGWEVSVKGTYNYSSDLSFELGYTHLFAEDGLAKDGNFVANNGTSMLKTDDVNYTYFETKLSF